MSVILFDRSSSLFYVPLEGSLSHIWITPTKERDEQALIELNNVPDIGPRSFFTPYPFKQKDAQQVIARGLACSEPLISDQVKEQGKLAQKDLPLYLLHVLRDSKTMRVIGSAGCFRPPINEVDPIFHSYNPEAATPADTNTIGYKLHPDYRGKGITTEAVKILMKFWKENRGYKIYWALCETDNPASQAVLLRNGFRVFAAGIALPWPENKGGGTREWNYNVRD